MNTKLFTGVAILVPFLFLACDDSNSPSGPTLSTVTQVSLVPLKVGDKWTMGVSDPDVTNGLESLIIVKDDSTYEGEAIYIGDLTVSAPTFTSDGSKISNLNETGRIFLRKSDQQVVYKNETVTADVIPVGSLVSVNVKILAETKSVFTGTIPTILTPGLAWTVKEVATVHTENYADGELGDETDSVETKTSSYTTKSIYNITVPAGTFAAIEMDHAVAETGESAVEYYSEEAKMTVKQTSKLADKGTAVFELRSLSLVK
ncbi:MAG: hypothetical protein JWO30_1835 [Fibrobacteres bacterium]|nr:hypothetical protein [Fibrobacterota bacterium]